MYMYIPQTVEPHPKSKVQVNIFIYRTHVHVCMYIPQTVEPHPKSKVQANPVIHCISCISCIYHSCDKLGI